MGTTGPTNPFTVDASALRASKSEGPVVRSRDALRGVRVLVVDDEDDARELIAIVLSTEGAEVCASASADDALERVASFEPDVIVSDIGMPGNDGLWLIARVRESHAALPAVALTGLTRREEVARVLAAGFDEHLGKPVDPRRLVETIVTMRT